MRIHTAMNKQSTELKLAEDVHFSKADNSTKIVNFGCRLNIAEGNAIRALTNQVQGKERLVVVNSCAVTNEAVRQVRQKIRQLKREDPGSVIVVTGCAAQIEGQSFANMAEVSRVLGNQDKFKVSNYHDLPQASKNGKADQRISDIMHVSKMHSGLVESDSNRIQDRVRAFVEIQNGCDHRCTFCIIPYGRGNSRSIPIEPIVNHVNGLVEHGAREIVLTGVDLTSWGADLPGKPQLVELLKRLLASCPNLERLRLSSLDGVEIDDAMIELIGREERIMPHLHLSIQSGSDLILKRMKRRHSRDDILRLVERLLQARPGLVFGADMIAGFPTETDAQFQDSLDLVQQCEIPWLHVFPYSPKKGTPAERMPQVPVVERKKRAGILRQAGQDIRLRYFRSLLGQSIPVLIETTDGRGHSDSFAPVHLPGEWIPGTCLAMQVTGYDDHGLLGRKDLVNHE